ncbi:MAG: sugar phosphate isomerase/epimerase [Armatimonadetes bacterium]|nr:sugar phosphate isomerase/epimerase [Armatimonadota bacterium]
MSRVNHQDIRIGTLAPYDKALTYLPQVLDHGFECYELTNWQRMPEGLDIAEHAKGVLGILGDKATISSLGVYGNPLRDDFTREAFATAIKSAKLYGASVVCGFAGAIEDKKVDEQMEEFRTVWAPLTKLAEDNGVRIGFENCDMGGSWEKPSWNIAHSPVAWEMMFNEVNSDALGLEWEPCHQMVSLIDPLPQLRKWVSKIVHVHGKDATIARDVLAEKGIRSGARYVHHRTPGFGDTNWTDVISILRQAKWEGAIDIEGWHDPVYSDDLEMTGQVFSCNYLKQCRGGAFVANPV